MQTAQQKFSSFIQDKDVQDLNIPVIANCSAEPYKYTSIKANLIAQITQPVLWVDTVHYLVKQGVTEFKEIGPGTVLQGLVNRILKSIS